MLSSPASDARADVAADVQLRRASAPAQREDLLHTLAGLGHSVPAASSARRTTTSRASAGCNCCQAVDRDARRPCSSPVDEPVQQLGLLAQQLAPCAARSPAPPDAPRAAPARAACALARARSGRRRCSYLRATASPALAAVLGRLLARHAQQRAHEPPLARGHPQQRAPARRGREPVEDRLDLIAGRVARPPPARRVRPPAGCATS